MTLVMKHKMSRSCSKRIPMIGRIYGEQWKK